MTMEFTKKISSCINVLVEVYNGDGKQVCKRRLQWKCQMPESCKADAEREAAMMESQAGLKCRKDDEWIELINKHFSGNSKLRAAVASVVFWDWHTNTNSELWEIAMSVGRKVLTVPHTDINAGLKLIGYVKPAYRAMTLRRILTKLDRIKVVGAKVVVMDK